MCGCRRAPSAAQPTRQTVTSVEEGVEAHTLFRFADTTLPLRTRVRDVIHGFRCRCARGALKQNRASFPDLLLFHASAKPACAEAVGAIEGSSAPHARKVRRHPPVCDAACSCIVCFLGRLRCRRHLYARLFMRARPARMDRRAAPRLPGSQCTLCSLQLSPFRRTALPLSTQVLTLCFPINGKSRALPLPCRAALPAPPGGRRTAA